MARPTNDSVLAQLETVSSKAEKLEALKWAEEKPATVKLAALYLKDLEPELNSQDKAIIKALDAAGNREAAEQHRAKKSADKKAKALEELRNRLTALPD